ncbi:SET domain-containing protein [Ditylenchus destructor]|nr:SET domain-containing protein [Ditylenchus destructor]
MCERQFGKVTWSDQNGSQVALVKVLGQEGPLQFRVNERSEAKIFVKCHRCTTLNVRRKSAGLRKLSVCQMPISAVEQQWLMNPLDPKRHICKLKPLPALTKRMTPPEIAQRTICNLSSTNSHTEPCAPKTRTSVRKNVDLSQDFGRVKWIPGVRKHRLACVDVPNHNKRLFFSINNISATTTRVRCCRCQAADRKNRLKRCTRGSIAKQKNFLIKNDRWVGRNPADERWHCCEFRLLSNNNSDVVIESKPKTPKKEILDSPASSSPSNKKTIIREINSDNFPSTSTAAIKADSVQNSYTKSSTYGKVCWYNDKIAIVRHPVTDQLIRFNRKLPNSGPTSRFLLKCDWCSKLNSERAKKGLLTFSQLCFPADSNQWYLDPLDATLHCCGLKPPSCHFKSVKVGHTDNIVKTNNTAPLPSVEVSPITKGKVAAHWGSLTWTYGSRGNNLAYELMPGQPPITFYIYQRKGQTLIMRCTSCRNFYQTKRGKGRALFSSFPVKNNQWMRNPLDPKYHCCRMATLETPKRTILNKNELESVVCTIEDSGAKNRSSPLKVKWVESSKGTRTIMYRSRLHSGIIYRFSVNKKTLGRNIWYARCLDCMRENRKRKQRGEEYCSTSGFAIDANEYWIDDPDKPVRPHVCSLSKIGKDILSGENNSDKHEKDINENSTPFRNALSKIRSPPSTNFGNVEWASSLKGNNVAVYRSRTHPGNVYRFTKNGCRKSSCGGMDVRCVFCESENNRRRKSGLKPGLVSRVFISADGKWTEDPEKPKNPHICVNSHTEISNESASRKSISKSPAEISSKISPTSGAKQTSILNWIKREQIGENSSDECVEVFPRNEHSSSKVLSTSTLDKMECDAIGNSQKGKNEVICASHLHPGLVNMSKAKRRKLNIEDENLADSKQTYGRVRWLKRRTLTTRRRVAIATDNAQNGSQLSYKYIIVGKEECGERLCCQFCLSANQKRRLLCIKAVEDQQIPFIWIRNGEWLDDPIHPKIPHICDGTVRKKYSRVQASGGKMNHGIGARRHRRRSRQANLSSSASPEDRLSRLLKRRRLQKRMGLKAVLIRKTTIGRRNANDKFISLHSNPKRNKNKANVPRLTSDSFLAPNPDEQGGMGNTSMSQGDFGRVTWTRSKGGNLFAVVNKDENSEEQIKFKVVQTLVGESKLVKCVKCESINGKRAKRKLPEIPSPKLLIRYNKWRHDPSAPIAHICMNPKVIAQSEEEKKCEGNSDSPSTSQYFIKSFVNNENSMSSVIALKNISNRSSLRKNDTPINKCTPLATPVLRERQNLGIPSIPLNSPEIDSDHSDCDTSDGIAKVVRNNTKCFEDQLLKANGVSSDAAVCILDEDVEKIDSLAGQSADGSSSGRKASSSMPLETFEDLNEDEDDEMLNKNGIYTVERILALRYTSSYKNPEYLLKWKDWRYETCTWEKQTDLSCEQLIGEFIVRHKLRLLIANKLNMPELPTFFMMQSFYSCQRWEDELNHIARENGQAPIYVENWVDNAIKPKAFTFITKNLISDDAQQEFKRPKDDGCKCTAANPCGYGTMCCPEVFPYTPHGRLRKHFDNKKEWIVECSDQCSCDITCPTRLVQRGRQIPIVLFRTADRGWSVRAAAKIEKNTFVMEYVGEVITIERAEQKSPTYQFQMDGCGASKCAFVVDAANCGNEARFVNHSCDPNMVVHSVYADRLDQRYLRLTYFACRDIEKGEEITINYNANVDNAAFAKRTKYRSVKSCFCKSETCRGFII